MTHPLEIPKRFWEYKPMDKFSVYQFFNDDMYECVRENVSAEEAMTAFEHYTHNVASRIGITKRVILTDSDDFINAEWVLGKGITYPTKEDVERKDGKDVQN